MHFPRNLENTARERLEAVQRFVDAEPRLVNRTGALRMEPMQDGRLQVHGEVSDVSLKRLITRRLSDAPGVGKLDAHIAVSSAQPMGDEEIRAHLVGALLREASFSACSIGQYEAGELQWLRRTQPEPREELCVAVEDGVVRLQGQVGDPSLYRLAEVMAWWVAGTRDVDNRVRSRSRPAGDDGELLDVIDFSLQKNPWLSANSIRPRVQSGVVTLTGYVKREADREMAEHQVWLVPGVRDVRNELRVSQGR